MAKNKILNVRLLRKVQRHILEEPKRLDMHDVAYKSDLAPCGTAGCIGGWACILSGIPYYEANLFKSAQNLLNPTGHEGLADALDGDGLFYTFPPNSYPTGSKKAALWVSKQIDKFIEKWGEVRA